MYLLAVDVEIDFYASPISANPRVGVSLKHVSLMDDYGLARHITDQRSHVPHGC
jgi:hypothetical protein